MTPNPTTKSQQTQTPPAPSSRPGSALSWADAVKTPSRSTTPDPTASPSRASKIPSARSSPSRPLTSATAPPKPATASSRRQGSQSPSHRQQASSSITAQAPASTKSADSHVSRTAPSAPAATPSPPTESSTANPADADDGEAADASVATAGPSSAASSKKRKKKKKAKADPSTNVDGAAAASDPALDPDLVALEEARQLAAIPVEHVEWAKRVIKLAERYTNRMGNTGPEGMRLTRVDDELYARFRADFPTFNVETVKQDELTGPAYTEKWQALHADFADRLPAVYAHHLMRPVAAHEYADDNTMMVTAAQFYAIEIARNREGANQGFYEALKDQVNSKAAAKP